MMYRSDKDILREVVRIKAFSLVEVVTALAILALISSSVLVVVNRCMASAADSTLRMNAFEVARENMETLLYSDLVFEKVEYGVSDRSPGIRWQTTVEPFYEPITNRMWIQAVCVAEYVDSAGNEQKVELTDWLTDVSKEQMLQILEQQQKQGDILAQQVIETEEDAAKYAGVDVETIRQWVENGMLRSEKGYFIRNQLDFYKEADGNPSMEERDKQAKADAELIEQINNLSQKSLQEIQGGKGTDVKMLYGYPVEELDKMSFEEVWDIVMKNRDSLK
jgi:prepilin-type N-terminal cleavage/methylation domain-containing protein